MNYWTLTSVCGGGIMAISYAGYVRTLALGKELPSILESLRITLFVLAVIAFIGGCAQELS